MKKLISIALVLAMVLAVLPIAALAAPTTGNYYVCGPANLTGTNWTPNSQPNRMTKSGTVYTKVYYNLAAGDYEFRITRGTMSQFWGDNGGSVTFSNGYAADVTITFDAASEKISVTGAGVGVVLFDAASITAAGTGAGGFLNNVEWDQTAAVNHMTNTDGVWSIKYDSVAAGTYKFKFAANDAWTDNWGFDGVVANDTWVDAAYNGSDASVVVDKDGSSVELFLDLSTYDTITKTGAKIKVFVLPPLDDEPIMIEEGSADLKSEKDSESVAVTYKPLRDGKLIIAFGACTPGWAYNIEMPNGTATLLTSGKEAASFEQDVFAGQTYKVYLFAYNHDLFSFADGSISYSVSFVNADVSHDVEKEAYDFAGSLKLGANNVTALDTALNTLYEFEPTATGVYTFTAPEGVKIGNWGVPSNPIDHSGDSKTNVVEWTCTAVGQPVLIGITADTTITVVKKAEADIVEQIDYVIYENVHTPSENQLINLDEKEPTPVDITKPQTVVKDSDGFYHLNTVDGPIVFVNLSNEGFDFIQGFFGGYGAHTMRGKHTVDGVDYYYDFLEAMREYATIIYNADNDNCLYPMTEDLAIFLKAYGGYQGWFDPDRTSYEAIQGEHNADSAWLVACCYLEEITSGGEIVEPDSGDNTPSPETGDFAFAPVAIIMVLAVVGVIALVPAKKFF